MLKRLLNHQTETVFFAAFWIGFFGLLSRFLGLLRNHFLASRFGVGEALDIYYTAFRLPDFIFNILIVGAISTVFIPIFTEYLHKDKDEAENFVRTVIGSFFIFLVIFSIILFFLSPFLIKYMAPGFSSEKQMATVALTRIMVLSPIFLGLSNILGSILMTFKKFLAYSLSPIFYNLGIIIGILFFTPFFGVYGLAIGVVLGAFLHLAIIIFPAQNLIRISPIFNLWHKGFNKMIKIIIPRIIGVAAGQLNLIIITSIASFLSAGSIAIFNLTSDFQYVPINIVAISYSIAVFPMFSSLAAKNEKDKFCENFTVIIRQILFFIIPLSFLFILLRAQIIRLVLGSGLFNWQDTRMTAAALAIFSISLFAQSLTPFFSRAFFAFQNTVSPLIASIISVIANVLLSFYLVNLMTGSWLSQFLGSLLKVSDINDLRILGLPLAFSLSSILNLLFLWILFNKKLAFLENKKLIYFFVKIFVISFLMAIFVYLTLYFSSFLVNMKTFIGVFIQTSLASLVGVVSYSCLVYIFQLKEFILIKEFLERFSLKRLLTIIKN